MDSLPASRRPPKAVTARRRVPLGRRADLLLVVRTHTRFRISLSKRKRGEESDSDQVAREAPEHEDDDLKHKSMCTYPVSCTPREIYDERATFRLMLSVYG
jgi:hypothetical protein